MHAPPLQVEKGSVKAPPAVEEIYRGVAAPSRLRVDEAPTVTEMPKVGGAEGSSGLMATLQTACMPHMHATPTPRVHIPSAAVWPC